MVPLLELIHSVTKILTTGFKLGAITSHSVPVPQHSSCSDTSCGVNLNTNMGVRTDKRSCDSNSPPKSRHTQSRLVAVVLGGTAMNLLERDETENRKVAALRRTSLMMRSSKTAASVTLRWRPHLYSTATASAAGDVTNRGETGVLSWAHLGIHSQMCGHLI